MWEVFPGLSDNFEEPTTIPLTNPYSTHTSTSSTAHYSTSPVSRTTTSHNYTHTIGYHYTDTTTSSNSNPKFGQTTLATIPQQSWLRPLSPLLDLLPPQDDTIQKEKQSKKSVRITTPKRHAPTLDLFVFTDIRPKHDKKWILLFK